MDGLTPQWVRDRWQNDLGELSSEERVAWQLVLTKLLQVKPLINFDDLSALRTWAPHVARFSFHLP